MNVLHEKIDYRHSFCFKALFRRVVQLNSVHRRNQNVSALLTVMCELQAILIKVENFVVYYVGAPLTALKYLTAKISKKKQVVSKETWK